MSQQQNDYQFVMIPQQLSSCLDANCHKMLSTLIGLHSILSNEDGWFYRSNKDLQLDVRLSENVVRATLDTLYRAGIINIDCIGKGRGHRTNRIHINFDGFKKYERYSFNDIRNNPDLWIETVKYKDHFVPSYMKKSEKICESKCERLCECICEKVSTITDTTDTSYTINTIENNILYNKEEKKPCSYEELGKIYSKSFGEFMNNYPGLNYSLIMLNQEDSFYECYEDLVNELVMKIDIETNRDITKDETLQTLKSYLVYNQYSYQ